MYHKSMTIKQRLFRSNIRMVVIAIFAFVIVLRLANVLFVNLFFDDPGEAVQRLEDLRNTRILLTMPLFALVLFMTIVSIVNNILTHRIIQRIVKPLEPLNEGVNQIRDNNFAYRIDYQTEDEFRPICDAFDKMAARLEASTIQREKDELNRRELISGISHDLRTPLTAICGYLDGIDSGVASTPEMREKYFNTIKKQAANMKQIIDQLFLLSILDMDNFPLAPHRFDIMRAISDMIDELSEEYAMRGFDIILNKHPENIIVYADVEHLRRVLINILENSVKYKEKETGRMEISAGLDNNFIQIKFADDGPGVNPEALPNLFSAFYRADPSRHTKGSGLGLAISAKIIERSGGTIHAENGESGGLVVIICLPIDKSGEAKNI